ncbi:MAG: PLP-dependent aminotransferase family protein, partial [Lachnospiraceae bacterium]|nr:PLP-dependent aminotransferase family protein [Lachnospiraceae bacterium]
MLTYSFEDRGSESLYEYLYKQIKNDIVNYRLSPDEKLPSKRELAKHLNISTITVENAYSQLMAEGYIYSKPKSGFYVSQITAAGKRDRELVREVFKEREQINKKQYYADFVRNSTPKASSFFNIWTKLMRETMSDNPDKLMVSSPSTGIFELRCEIAKYLFEFRGMKVEPDRIVIGAGTEYLYGIIIQLLGHGRTYAVEDPGYQKIAKIYRANDVKCVHIPVDKEGVNVAELEKTGAEVLHISPSHHFPTGIVTPISRRYEILSWASKEPSRYIIEDDYDSEFRFVGKPIPSLQSIDVLDKVIYINTFSKSLASTIRIRYMVLPKELMESYN